MTGNAALARWTTVSHVALIAGFGVLAGWLLWLQRDELQWHDPGAARWLGAAMVSVGWLGLFGWLRYRSRWLIWRQALVGAKSVSAASPEQSAAAAMSSGVRVVYASQTGFAEQLARQTLQSLHSAGVVARLYELDALTVEDLRTARQVLFVVSTTGDGEPPDRAATFSRLWMQQPALLTGLRYGLLALGDRDYEEFCGFGRQLRAWLQSSGARPLFDPVEVDSEDAASLRHWQHHLAMFAGVTDLPDWETPRYQPWRLVERQLLNPGSVGEACFQVSLQPLQGSAHWQAGDLVEIGPCHAVGEVAQWLAAHALDGRVSVMFEHVRQPLEALLARCRLPAASEVDGLDEAAVAAIVQPLPHREYSIASLPADRTLELLIRQMRGPGGQLGIGSGWLTEHAPLGAEIALRVRSNVNFHAPVDGRPLVLIGNGTGLAALRALLKERIVAGRHRNWLLFGERHAAHDFYYRDEIERWLREGQLERVDFAWSREQAERIHVQHRLQQAAPELRRWVDAGAAIHVCGSLDGMAPAVDAVLRKVLGDARVDQLREQGNYRRDVY